MRRHAALSGLPQTHLQVGKRQKHRTQALPEHFDQLLEEAIRLREERRKIQTYLSSAFDDHSRFLLHSRFYDSQDEAIVEDPFHQVILRYGKFDACYFDNGSQYIARQLKLSLAKLGIRVMYARPHSGKSKGKIEKSHQVVDKFNREAKLKNIRTLEELNRYWSVFLEEYYHCKPHEGIREYYESLGQRCPGTESAPGQNLTGTAAL